MTSYEEILESAKRLSSEERLQLADALLAEELGFGMWRKRDDVVDAEAYVAALRKAAMVTPGGQLKTPEEFLREIETFDE
jgi:glycine/D-amino acid oxidase-like deaminating enzyme